MQLGFIMVEAAATRKQHWSGIVMKNLLDSITGALAFWIIGFGLAFSTPDSRGFIGIDGNVWATSAGWGSYASEDLYLKFLFQFAFVNTSSAIVGGLLTERCRIETYAAISFIMTLFIYPVVACWVWNPAGWLALRGYHDFAGSSVVHLVGGMSGLVGSIFVGPRINRFKSVQFPILFRESREKNLQKYNQELLEKVKNMEQLQEVKELVEAGTLSQADLGYLKAYTINEFHNPNYEFEEESSIYMSIGTFVLWLGWYFFNGGSAYTLYNSTMNPAKIITNTILGGASAGGTVYFVKKPI